MQEIVKQTLESIPAAIIVVDEKSQIIFANRHLLNMFGWGPELIGEELGVLIPKRFGSKHRMLVGGYLSDPTERVMGGEDAAAIWAVKKNGEEFRIRAGLSFLKTDSGRNGLAVITWDLIQIDHEAAQLAGDELGELEMSLRKFRKHINNLHGGT